MFLHQLYIRGIHKAESTVVPLFNLPKRLYEHVIIHGQKRNPFLRLKEIVYQVVEILLIQKMIALNVSYGFCNDSG